MSDYDAVLVATGRRPNTDGLNAQAAGVELTARGAIVVDDLLRTSAPGVWAAGDIAGGHQFTYISLDDYRIIAPQIIGQESNRTTQNRTPVPYNVFLEPSFARVGLNETDARNLGLNYRIVTLPTAAIPKAQVLRETAGMLKALIDNQTNEILGAMLICPDAHELINLIVDAMANHAPYTSLRDRIYTHPSMSEALNDLFV